MKNLTVCQLIAVLMTQNSNCIFNIPHFGLQRQSERQRHKGFGKFTSKLRADINHERRPVLPSINNANRWPDLLGYITYASKERVNKILSNCCSFSCTTQQFIFGTKELPLRSADVDGRESYKFLNIHPELEDGLDSGF